MKIIQKPEALRREILRLRGQGKQVGFVPTMGALHEGHLSLVRTARRENDVVVASIFVNPIQFGPNEDFKKYPRPAASDREKLRKEKVDYLFAPGVRDMYPEGYATTVKIGQDASGWDLTKVLCGKFRPGHFNGVATVVAKLFYCVLPDRAYFGAKDYQQTVVVRRMIQDLNMGIQLRVLSTRREKDGLALSSRNQYLSAADRKRAPVISRTLFWLRLAIERGKQRNLSALKQAAFKILRKGIDRVQYLELVDSETLKPVKAIQGNMVALTACYVGKTRLIDNVIIQVPNSKVKGKK